ncbi:MAG: hypothetical protein O2826_02675 [Chloroflexi bacterium]|nr:hypothetical protein [Chloroflexota bacterium]MDA1173404.1 hypothetical protein [Chloroflexota bacterium]
MTRILNWSLLLVMLLGGTFMAWQGAAASPTRQPSPIPDMPDAFHGTVTIAGGAAAANTVICGHDIGDTAHGCLTTTLSGLYGGAGGLDSKLLVSNLELNAEIRFFVTPPGTVGGYAAETVFYHPGGVTQLDLTLATAPSAAATPTPPPSSGGPGPGPGPAATATPTVPAGPAPVGAISVLEMTVSPTEVKPGEPVTLSMTVSETAGVAVTDAPVTIRVNGESDQVLNVTLAASGATIVTATVTRFVPGGYLVIAGTESVPDGPSGQFVVFSAVTPTPTPGA